MLKSVRRSWGRGAGIWGLKCPEKPSYCNEIPPRAVKHNIVMQRVASCDVRVGIHTRIPGPPACSLFPEHSCLKWGSKKKGEPVSDRLLPQSRNSWKRTGGTHPIGQSKSGFLPLLSDPFNIVWIFGKGGISMSLCCICFLKIFIYVWVFTAAWAFSGCSERGLLSSCSKRASCCGDLSFRSTGSRVGGLP